MASRKKTKTRRNSRVVTSAALATAALACCLAATPVGAGDRPRAIGCDHNVVTAGGGATDRQVLVEAITAACGLRLVQHAAIDGRASLPRHAVPLADAIDGLLANDSYQLFVTGTTGKRRGALWIFAEGATLSPDVQLLFETTLLQAGVSERRSAVRQLRRLANADAVALLSLALTDPDARIRDAAEEALEAIGGSDALAALASGAASDEAAIRADTAVAVSLAYAGNDEASTLGYLSQSLADSDPKVRAATVHALGNIDAPGSRRLLRQALGDPSDSVREAALDVLEDLDDEALFQAVFPGTEP